jgi:hypothetical protein
MSNDKDKQNRKDERSADPNDNHIGSRSSAQSQSKPIGDEERQNREGAGESRRNGSESNAS